MRKSILLIAMLAASPALADDRALITQHEQDMSDALVPGNAAPWDKYLDPSVIYAEEDGTYKGKKEMLAEIRPLPKGLGGTIKVESLSYHQEGDTAVSLFRQIETEQYFGQTIHATYLNNTTWKKRADGWKMIACQILAEKTDPPAVTLPAADLQKFTGTYKLRNSEPTYALSVTDGKLMGVRGTHPPAEWKAETREVFFIPGDNRIRKIFQYDAQGNVTGFLERRESWDIYWDKVS